MNIFEEYKQIIMEALFTDWKKINVRNLWDFVGELKKIKPFYDYNWLIKTDKDIFYLKTDDFEELGIDPENFKKIRELMVYTKIDNRGNFIDDSLIEIKIRDIKEVKIYNIKNK